LEDAGFDVLLVNSRHVKNLPGRKTDVADATWLAQLGAHGLVRASFVPPEPIRQLRDLTRARTAITRERSREVQRLEKLLEDAGIKLSVVASDIFGVSGRAMMAALIAGDATPRCWRSWHGAACAPRSAGSRTPSTATSVIITGSC
jgi:transposase